MSEISAIPTRLPRRPLLLAAALIAAEFLVIGLVFKHGIRFDCQANWGNGPCSLASRSLAALYCMIGAAVLFAALRPAQIRALLSDAGRWPPALWANLAGFALAMVPVALLREGSGATALAPAFAFWGIGMALLLGGLLFWLAPPARWRAFAAASGATPALVLAIGAAAPALAARLQPIWQLETISGATFSAVSWIVRSLGYDLIADPVLKHIGTTDFMISVAPVCSGVEGIALVTIFVSLYLWLFRADLRFPRALLLCPAGIAASALLNVVRISALLILGIEGQPELAVGGFHSHAGWIMFTAVALGIIAIARRVPALQRTAVTPAHHAPLPIRRDPVAARILPFAVFMLTATVAPAFSQNPAVFYPLRVLCVAVALALVWPALRGLSLRVSPRALGAGAAVGIGWVLIPVAPSDTPPFGALSGGLVVLWFLFRGIGTVLIVPLIEELFFRDYLESRLRGSGLAESAPPWRSALAIAASAGLFALLHDRWAEAFAAGVIFSLVVRRSGRIEDAIGAHALANLVVFGTAVATGNLAII